MTILAIALAVLGAVFFSTGALLQHGVVTGLPGRPRIGELVRAPRWLGGLALLGSGAGVHAVALAQPFAVAATARTEVAS
ncbi:hypothetical protein [Amycolatopsis sp. Poz14]|uniref:hypothetical protein n=1 Tax=Amycolatopsis sp. Poz14 TaxID=1447705 RepID=UPI001EE797A7|nr:hypothetical protein [Amycolatopsis sp. Poz14]